LSDNLNTEVYKLNIFFPKLRLFYIENSPFLNGNIDILDTKGNYLDTFNVAIAIPDNYPYGIPKLKLISHESIWNDERHISNEGICCVEIDHILTFASKKGITLLEFLRNWVYPFLMNQIYFNHAKQFANGEYPHGFEGIQKFYAVKLGLTDIHIIVLILKSIINNLVPGNNDPCICGSEKKFKHCHKFSVKYLKDLGRESASKDLIEFNKLVLLDK